MNEVEKKFPDSHRGVYARTIFGFWVYLLTDFMMFTTLFAVYSVLDKNTFGGPTASDLFHSTYSFVQALVLLTASFTAGIAGTYAHKREEKGALIFFGLTFLLGIWFMGMMGYEFHELITNGHTWHISAFLSAYFTLVGTHGLHMIIALLWTIVLVIPVIRFGMTPVCIRRLTCLRMFWQFLNIVWIFIFTIVYLGVN